MHIVNYPVFESAEATVPSAPTSLASDGPSSFEKFDSAFSDLPASPTPPAQPAQPSAEVSTPPPAAAAAEVTAPGKPESTASTASQPVQQSPASGVPQFKTNKELRAWAYEQHQQAKSLSSKIAELEKAKSVVDNKDPKSEEERLALVKRSEDLQKRIDEYEGTVKLLNYESSNEYKTKYLAPYKSAVDSAAEVLKELVVTQTDEDTGDETERPANWDDFKRLFDMQLGHQAREARKVFGEAAPIVMQHISDIKKAAKAANSAKEEYKAKYRDLEKEELAKSAAEQERQQSQMREVADLWTKVNSAMRNDQRGQAYWGEEKDDKQANEELAKGFALADRRFSSEYSALPMNEKVILDATIRHRVAGFQKLAYLVGKKNAEIASLNEAIAKLRGSAPGKPSASTVAAPAPDEQSPMEKFDSIE